MLTLTDPSEAKTEVVRYMPVEDYNARHGLRQSLLKTYAEDFKGCPALYKYRSTHPDSYDSKVFIEGRAFHCMLLEPRSFNERYRILTDSIREDIFQKALIQAKEAKSKAGYAQLGSWMDWKEKDGGKGFTALKAYKEWLAEDPSREVIVFEDKIRMEHMIQSIQSNPYVMEEFEGVTLDDFEVSMFAPHDFKDGRLMQLKCRTDIVGTGPTLLDLKTCRTTNARQFASDAAKMGYIWQAAFYCHLATLNGMKKNRFGFLAIEKEPPFLCCIHFVPELWLKYGRIRFKHVLSQIAESIRTDNWPHPTTGELEVPGWQSGEVEAVA